MSRRKALRCTATAEEHMIMLTEDFCVFLNCTQNHHQLLLHLRCGVMKVLGGGSSPLLPSWAGQVEEDGWMNGYYHITSISAGRAYSFHSLAELTLTAEGAIARDENKIGFMCLKVQTETLCSNIQLNTVWKFTFVFENVDLSYFCCCCWTCKINIVMN